MDRQSLSGSVADVFELIEIKHENSLHLDADQPFYAESLASRDSFDDDRSVSAASAHDPFSANRNMLYGFASKPSTDDAVQKKEEKPVVHRNTGKISIENNRRRRHRLMSLSAQNLNRRFFTANTSYGQQTASPVTTLLRIEPILPHTSSHSSIQTSPMSEDNVVVLSDDEEDDVQSIQQQQQNRPPPPQSNQIQPALISAIFNAVQQNVTSFQLQMNQRTPVHCDVCNQTYTNRSYLRQHEKTIKHRRNLQASGQPDYTTNGIGGQ